MKSYTVNMPLGVVNSKGKVKSFNLNQYRNWHFRTAHSMKKIYHELAIVEIIKSEIPKLNKITMDFKLYKKSRVQRDKANFLCIHEKFFCDALVEHGILDDDSDEYILSQRYLESEIDKDNPRVEVTINVHPS